MGEQTGAAKPSGADRITTLDGVLLSAEDLTVEQARRQHQELRAAGTPHLWERYCGARTGWNNVSAFHGGAS